MDNATVTVRGNPGAMSFEHCHINGGIQVGDELPSLSFSESGAPTEVLALLDALVALEAEKMPKCQEDYEFAAKQARVLSDALGDGEIYLTVRVSYEHGLDQPLFGLSIH